MRCSDVHFHVIKLRNNPQHLRVLANELFATRLAELIGLPVPVTELVEVDKWLIQHSPELNIQLAGNITPCESGLQFGSRYVANASTLQHLLITVTASMPANGHSRTIRCVACLSGETQL